MSLKLLNLEDVYELSPLQQGILFHALRDAEVGTYFMQSVSRVDGLDVPAFKEAWQRLVQRHTILRTSFHQEDSDKPVQVVHRQVAVPFEEYDWRDLSPREQQQKLRAWLRANRRRGFVLTEAPLLRVALFRLAGDDYQYVFSRHHILLDGWSSPLVHNDLLAFYEAWRSGRDLTLPPARPYRDYIVWLQEQNLARAEAYWRHILKGFSAPTLLPLDRGPGRPAGSVEAERLLIPADVTAGLQGLARQERLTLNILLQSAWALLLRLYSSQDDVVFGAAFSGRPPGLPGVESMVGLFINTLPVRVRMDADERVLPWLKGLMAQQVETQQYEYSPLVHVQGWGDVPRGTPLFESLVLFENLPVERPARSEKNGRQRGKEDHAGQSGIADTNYPLTLLGMVKRDELALTLSYATGRFDPDVVNRLLAQLQTMLANIVADPTQRLADLLPVSKSERRQVLHEWNNTATAYPQDQRLHELIEAQVERTPERTAISFANRRLTYREMNTRVNQLAHHLRSLGVGPDVLVGLCLERSEEMVVALLAVLKAGGAYVPLDPAYPPERIGFMLADSRTPLVVTQQALAPGLSGQSWRVLCLDTEHAAIQTRPADNPKILGRPDNLAYVIYTSGSTGKPKGVQIPHSAVVNFLCSMRRVPGLSEQDTLLAVTTLSFDIAGLELYLPLIAGACLHLVSREVSQDAALLAEEVSAATVMQATPATWRMLLEAGWTGQPGLKILCGGEALPADLARKLLSSGASLWNMYGPTETTIYSTCHRVEQATISVPIGKPIANTQVYIVDEQGQPVPVGVAGELLIGGEGVARGYWNRPALTAEKFIPDPFSGRAGARLYRTGDLARWLPPSDLAVREVIAGRSPVREVVAGRSSRPEDGLGGNLECLGRFDQQVKVRGFRIEPGEIEAVLAEQPGIQQSVVVAREMAGGSGLAAYVVAHNGVAADDLRSALRQRLPEYMVPSVFVKLPALPLTPNGKVDRKALPAPEFAPSEQTYVSPCTPLEETIAAVWCGVLRVERVGRHDNFFELGGHSLLATQVVARLRAALTVEVPLRLLFEAPSVAELAQRMTEVQPSKDSPNTPLLAQPRREAAPLSFAQQRLWFLHQWEPDSPVYNVPGARRLHEAVDVAALERALTEVVRRHEILRTTFAARPDEQPVQIVHPPCVVHLPVEDLSGLSPPQRQAELRRRVAAERRRGFDLEHGPLLRCVLLRLGAGEHLLLLNLHHIVTDGWSQDILFRELFALYEAFAAGQGSPLPELPLQYADYALWQRNWLRGELLQGQLDYWKSRLARLRPLEMPTDKPRPAVQRFRGAHQSFDLPAELAEGLRRLSQQQNATLFMTLLAGFQGLLGRYSRQRDVVVGSPIAGRQHKELENLIGFFVNTLVLRADLSGNPTFVELLGRVKETCLGAYAHQDLPFEKLVEELQPQRDPSRNPLFQVTFALQNTAHTHKRSAASKPAQQDAPEGISKFDLTLVVNDNGKGLSLHLGYNTDLFESATIGRLARNFQTLLEAVVARPDDRLTALPCVDQDERRQLLCEWNNTATAAVERCVHELFLDHVVRNPAAPAAVFQDQVVSYGELNVRADELAVRLRRSGARRGAVVGVCVERSVAAVVAVLAVFKSGAAYLPLDPAAPRDRLAFLLQDAAVSVLLTQSHLRHALPDEVKCVLLLDQEHPCAVVEPAGSWEVLPRDLAYVIYTSGTTGKPRGVLVEHSSLSNLVVFQTRTYGVGPGSRILQFASLNFDASVAEIWRALSSGACLVLAETQTLLPGPDLIGLLEQQQVTHATLPPSVLAALPDASLPALRTLIVGGEACSAELVKRWGIGRRFFNAYGPTEATVCSSVALCLPDGTRPPIGKPIANTSLFVLDAELRLVPIGVPGELHIGGVGLARGYLNSPRLTAERFIPDPFGTQPGARLYKTGDLVRWLPQGNLEFLGRTDEQVKVRGFRIEPGEIEAVLRQHAAVRQCVVVVRQDAGSDKRLVAYLAADGTQVKSDDLRLFLKSQLPDYMVPSAFVVLAVLPLTGNGKVDRKALPAPELAPSEEAYVPPQGPVEEAIASIWRGVLRLERVGRHDSFFELGGHSLLATQVVARLRAALTVEVPLRLLFEAPSVAALAQRIADLRGEKDMPRTPPLVAQPRTGPLPLSFAQQRLWFLHQWEPDSPVYNVSAARRLHEAVDLGALERALSEMVRRHEILRTTFAARPDEQPVQIVHPPCVVHLPVEDLSGLSPPQRQAELRRRVAAERRRGFDLEHGPLLRCVLLRLGAGEHLLLLNLHHIVTDGWSQDILFRELFALYEAFAAGQGSPLSELPLQYADYALWQRNWLRGELLQSQLDYWKSRLARLRPLEMPTDKPRPAVQRFRGAHQSFDLPAELAEGLRRLSQQQNATLFMTLLAGFQALLGRYSRQRDVVVGSPIAGRQHKELENLIGFFVNTLVLRADLSGNPTFVELLGRVKETCLGAYAHQDLPFEKLVEELQPQRDPSRNPLFQVTFALQNTAHTHKRSAASKPAQQDAPEGISKFDLTLVVNDNGKGLSLHLGYNTDLFESATIGRLARNFQTLLEAVVARPDDRLAGLPCVDQDERRQLLCEWNNTATAAVERCVHELFLDHVVRNPAAPAAVFQDSVISYGELNVRADELAVRLRRSGARRGAVVGVCVERSVAAVVAVLAVFKSGAAYLPLDPAAPRDRLAFLLQDAAVSVLLTQSHLRHALPDEVKCVLLLDQEHPCAVVEPAGSWEVLPRDLAYVIYTSGTTGKPRGVLVEHSSLSNLVVFQTRTYGVGPGSRILQFASLNFDASVAEIWRALSSGACLVLAETQTLLPGPDLIGLLEQQQVTHATLPPSVLAALPDASLPALRTLIVGGEACSAELVKRWGIGRRFFNAYGPTEATVCSSVALCLPDGTRPPIGKPIANTSLFVLDAELRLVPIGVPGELHIGGVGLARGYLNSPRLTAERFIPDPFGTQPGARLYKTGDLVRWLPQGNLEFLGRTDEQVKVRGFRIEPGEIEAVLRQHAAVRQCVVVVRQDAGSDKRLVAYLAADGTQVKSDDLRLFLKSQLPDYMVPSAFVVLAVLPLTGNGKVDRKALPAPELAPSEEAYVPPQGPVEEAIASIWRGVLRLERVGRHDSFFELGGHSLLATQVVARLRAALTVEVPLRLLFEAPSVAALAQRIADLRGEKDMPRTPPLVAQPRTGSLPLSFAQQRLWFLHQWEPDSPVYNVPAARRLHEAVDVAALERALSEVVRRHEILRTTFAARDEQPTQIIHPPCVVHLPVEDLSGLSPPQRQAELRRRVAAERRRGFDLEHGPLLRCVLLRLGAGEHLLLLNLHHIVTDGWSQDILFRELFALYEAFAAGQGSPLPELPLQYADYALWQRNWLRGELLQSQLDYWKSRLARLRPLEMPTDKPRPAVQRFRGAHQSFDLPAELAEGLRRLSQQQNATLFMTLLAGFQALLGRYSRQRDVVVGSPIAGRQHKELENLIGFFVNTLVLRADLSGNPTFVELLGRVKETCLGAYAHQDLPFEKLVEELQPQRDPSRNPLFQVTFALQNTAHTHKRSAASKPAQQDAPEGISKFDLTLVVNDNGKGLSLHLGYNTDLFESATIGRLARNFQTLLEAVVARPDDRLTALPCVDQDERRQLLCEWNNTATAAVERCVHELFLDHVVRNPAAPAAVFQDSVISYGELNVRADELAVRLRRSGARRGAVVGVCVERSVAAVVAVLAVFKSGAAYLPLDPAAPRDRLAFLLQDAAVSVLLTQSHLRHALPADVAQVLLDQEHPCAVVEPAGSWEVLPRDLAYVIYTSGTTGKPRGVLVEHRSLSNLVVFQTRTYGVGPGSRILQFASLNFDASVAEIWRGLSSGACLVLAETQTLLPGPDLIGLLEQQQVTHATLPPSVLAALPDASLPALRTLIVGGEACSAELVKRWGAGRRFFNAYGPTEATVCSSVALCLPDGTRPPIGKPIANTSLFVLDAELRLVPIGVPGELHIGGVGLARGYLNRRELTAEKFIPDPFGTQPGARLYKTGDLVRWLPQGNLEFLGRTDEQVKVRGFRIEPGEIEAVLRQHAAVRQCVVVARQDAGSDKRLVAYLAADSTQVKSDDLRLFLKSQLPDYMVPSAFVVLPALPLTSNGKVDRNALPAPEFRTQEVEQAYVAPRSPVEASLARIWAAALRLPRVGVHDNFFALGGDSIRSIQLVARINAAGLRMTAKDLFQHQTVAELAAVVARAGQDALAEQEAVIGPVPLTPMQHRFFLQNLSEAHGCTWVVLREMRQPVDLDLLEQAVRHVLEHHDALRLRFVREESGWRQENAGLEAANLSVLHVDLSNTPAEEQDRTVEKWTTELQAGFDLASPPLLRVAWFDLGQRPGQLLVIGHPLVADAGSSRIIMQDLLAVYQQLRTGKSVQLPLKTTSFKRWAEHLVDSMRSQDLRQELGYWLDPQQAEAPRLPVDHPDGVNSRDSADLVVVELAAEETQALLQEVPKSSRIQVSDLLLTALIQTIQGWTARRSLLVTLEGDSREESSGINLSRTVGAFTTLYPALLEVGEASNSGEALKAVKDQLERVPHRGIGYGLLRSLGDAGLVEQLRGMPAPEVAFHCLGNRDVGHEEVLGPGEAGLSGLRRHLLEVNASVMGTRLCVCWVFSKNLHEHATIEALANRFLDALQTLMADNQAPQARALTAEAFPAARLSAEDFEKLLARMS